MVPFHLNSDGPNRGQQFSPHRRYRTLTAAGRQKQKVVTNLSVRLGHGYRNRFTMDI
jgi:hypothetical protein